MRNVEVTPTIYLGQFKYSGAFLANICARCLSSEKFSDFQIFCGEHVFYVHRIVVADRCEYFRRLTESGFEVRGFSKTTFQYLT